MDEHEAGMKTDEAAFLAMARDRSRLCVRR
jgi:hypothetical protein